MFYIGCPAWGYSDWSGHFFPARTAKHDFLRLYSRRLSTVEGNTTFYALPSKSTIEHWAQETPATFRFCPKVLRSISHEPDLATKQAETIRFIEHMRSFGERLGPIFLQLPPSFAPHQLEQLQAFLDFWPKDFRLAVEVRHPEFYTMEKQKELLNTLLKQYNVGRVIMDTRPIHIGSPQEQQMLQARERKPDLPLQIVSTTNFAFVRYIGNPQTTVNETFLTQWATQLALWYKQGMDIYVFCHCPFEQYSPEICFALYEKVRSLVPLPTLSWQSDNDDTTPEQMSLF